MRNRAGRVLGILAWAALGTGAEFAQAGPVGPMTNFTAGTTAKASEVNGNFDAVKSAVDDNDGRITSNAAGIATNATGITTNAANITTNAGGVATNSAGIAANATAIAGKQDRVTGTCVTGSSVRVVNSDGSVICQSFQTPVIGSCPAGQAVRAVNANGTVLCEKVNFFGGDGSAGDLTVAASTSWNGSTPANLNFANVTINAGQTLTVPSGTTIRCSGSFVNNGTITVLDNGNRVGFFTAESNLRSTPTLTNLLFSVQSNGPDSGDAAASATNGEWSTNSALAVSGGLKGVAMRLAAIRSSIAHLIKGGGAGGGGLTGGSGGGVLRVLCNGSITNAGQIIADGANGNGGGGGGGGGIVVLASMTSVQHLSGAITANGGIGGAVFRNITIASGAGGGGGGGIVALIAPTVVNAATIITSGGPPGDSTADITNDDERIGGGGGGASGGDGGTGGTVTQGTAANNTGNAGAGSLGQQISLQVRPDGMF